MQYLVRNARPEPATVTIRQQGLSRFNEVMQESTPGRRNGASELAWDVSVPANGETELRFTLQQWW